MAWGGAGDCNRGEGADNELLCGGPFAQGDCTESCVGIVTSVFTAGFGGHLAQADCDGSCIGDFPAGIEAVHILWAQNTVGVMENLRASETTTGKRLNSQLL